MGISYVLQCIQISMSVADLVGIPSIPWNPGSIVVKVMMGTFIVTGIARLLNINVTLLTYLMVNCCRSVITFKACIGI